MDHEEESEVAKATHKEGTIGKHTIDRRAKEARADDECANEMWRTQRG